AEESGKGVEVPRGEEEVQVEHGPEANVGIEGLGVARGAEQDDSPTFELIDGALEVDELHHVVVERALVNGEQPVPGPFRRTATAEPVLQVVGREWCEALGNRPVDVSLPGRTAERHARRRKRGKGPEGVEEGRRHAPAGPLADLSLLPEGDDLRALDDGRNADPEDGRGDDLSDLLECKLVVAVHF